MAEITSPSQAVNKLKDNCYGAFDRMGCVHLTPHGCDAFCDNPEKCKGPIRREIPKKEDFREIIKPLIGKDENIEPGRDQLLCSRFGEVLKI